MKIARLELRAFGPFTDLTLELDAGDHGLHVIYGPNEAGKSSTLRALKNFLYGIPNRSSDNFVHAYPDLRIGAALRNGSGDLLECIRRKATKNDLRAKDDVAPLDPGRLAKCLGGLDREAFEAMFGIDHPTLVQGGREIVKGGGGLGQILFAAGSGIADLKAVQKRLDDAAAALFVPRGSVPKINKNLSEFDKAKKAIREAQLPSSEWEKHDKQLRQARERLAELESQLQMLRHERSRWERLHAAAPLAAQRAPLAAQRTEAGEVRLLPEDFAGNRREAVSRLASAEEQAREAEEAIRELDAQLAQLHLSETLVAESEAIERLQDDLGGFRKAQRDLPGLQAARSQREADARALLTELRPDLALEQIESLRLSRRQQLELQNLGNRYEAVVAREKQAKENHDRRSQRLSDAEREMQAIEPPRDVKPLINALRRAQGQAHLEEEAAGATAELDRLRSQTESALSRLGLWQGRLEELEQLAAPTAETIDRFDSELAAADARLVALAQEIAKAESNLAALDQQVEQLRLEGAVPSEAELSEARGRRETGWRLVRQQWLDGKANAAAEKTFIGGAGADLAGAYEQSVRQADDVADRLRREADRVAARAALQANRSASAAELEKLAQQQEQAALRQAGLAADWAALWRAFTTAPLSPREMRSWDARRQWLLQQAEALRKQQTALNVLVERIEGCRGELSQALETLGEAPAARQETLTALLERAQLVADRVSDANAERRKLSEETASLERDLSRDGKEAAEAEAELKSWSERWQQAVKPLGLPPDATPAQANEVLAQLNQLFAKLQEAAGFAERIEGITRESEQFLGQVERLIAALAPECRQLAAEAAAEKLIARQRQVVADKGKLDALQKQRERQATLLERARQNASQARGALAALCQEAGCARHEELPALEQASAAARELQRDLKHVDEQLLSLAAGAPLDGFLAEVEKADLDSIPSRLAELSEQLERCESERAETNRTIGSESKTLADMDSSAGAADAADRAQSLLAELTTDIEEYARLRLASAVLAKAIERYREKNQGPVLERASKLFAELTVGSFAGLRADFNEQGDAVLVGVRAGDGKPVGVDAMSDGTADQLYLALRLASLETYLDENEPIPFIVDDILVKFDDARSVAALQALAALSRRTQVIFFTHHQHLLDLAERHVAAGEFFVHRLPRAL